MAGAQTATLARDEVERLVLDGFFPVCDARARPYRTQSGLRDWGLPYAADSAITRHLADFLRDRPRVDAVLFNGGSLHAAVLRQRVLDQIAAWRGGARPIELENAEPDLAVARGAARFGKLLHDHAGRIAAGAARAVFLPVQMALAATNHAGPPALICVLPLNAAAEQVFEINLPGLELRTDQLVSFQACSSTRHGRCRPGDVLPWDADAFHALPLNEQTMSIQSWRRYGHGSPTAGGFQPCGDDAVDDGNGLVTSSGPAKGCAGAPRSTHAGADRLCAPGSSGRHWRSAGRTSAADG